MELNKLIEQIKMELSKEIKEDPSIGLLVRSESEESLFSFLREKIFRTDVKTHDFINGVKNKHVAVDVKIEKNELSESEFGSFLHKSLEKSFKEKGSKFKLKHHYFSPEKDLVIRISDEHGFDSVYRILVVKTT